MSWPQLFGLLLGGGAASTGLLLLRLVLGFCRYVMRHRALTAVINREGSTPVHWKAAADALATIDDPGRARQAEDPPSPDRHPGQLSVDLPIPLRRAR